MARTVAPLTPIPEYPVRKDPQERFDTKIKEAVDGGATMVRELNEGFIPQVDALAADVEAAMDAALESGASAAASMDAAAQSATASEASRQAAETAQGKAETARAGAETAQGMAEEAATVSAQVLAERELYLRLSNQAPMLTRVDAMRAEVSTVAGIEADVVAVAEKLNDLSTLYASLSTMEKIESNLDYIVAVDNAEEAIRQTATHRNSIAAVSANMEDVNAVAGVLDTIAVVNTELPHVKTVSEHIGNVDAVGQHIAAVQEVERRMQLVIDAAGNAATADTAAQEATRQAELARQHAESASAAAGLPAATEQNDQQTVIWSKDEERFIFGAPVGVNLVPAPPITVASQVPVGFESPILFTGLIGLVGTTINSFQLQVNDADIQDLTATNDSYSGVINPKGVDGAVWTIKARAIDSKDNVSAWNQATTVLVVPFVNNPTVTLPASNTIVSNKTVLMECAPFGTTHHVDTHKASRWIISTDAEGNNVLHDSGWRQDALLSYTATLGTVAEADSVLFVHVQHEGLLLGQSAKSSAIPVKTSYVLKPSVTAPLVNSMVGTVKIEMDSNDFATYAGDFDTHVASRWWVTTDPEGNNALCDSGWVSSPLTGYTATLSPVADPASDLYLWVAHRGEFLGDSLRSSALKVTTAFVQTPVMTARGEFTLSHLFKCDKSMFCPAGGAADKMIKDHTQIATDAHFATKIVDVESWGAHTGGLTIFRIPAQPQGTTLYARIRYKGETLGWSDWSEPAIQTVATVGDVTISSPVNGSIHIPAKPQIVMSAFTDNGDVDRGINTQVQISTTIDFYELAYDSGELAYSTSHIVATALAPSVQYFVRARHKGAGLGWADWSGIVGITTGRVETPTITSPTGNEILQPSFAVTGTAFTAFGTDALEAVTIQVAKDSKFTDTIYDQREVTTSTTRTVSVPPQAGSPALYVRMRYEGHALGTSDWSDVVKITVSPVLAPAITSPAAGITVYNAVTVVASPLALADGTTDSHASTDWKLTSDAAGKNIVVQALKASGTVSHTFAGFEFTAGNTYYLWARHNGTTYGAGPWSEPRTVKIEIGNTPGGRYLYRHSSNKGSVVEFFDGQLRKVLILDAVYRDRRKWGTYEYDMPNLKNYGTANKGGNWDIDGDGDFDAATNPPVMTDAQINTVWVNSIDEKTARQNCDEWMTMNTSTDSSGVLGVPAVAYARSVFVNEQACDVPNIQTLMRIMCDADVFDALDPTVAANPTKALGSQNPGGFWGCMGINLAFSSTEASSNSMRYVNNVGRCQSGNKRSLFFITPVLEL